MTLSEPAVVPSASKFQSEPVEGRKVSKVIKTTVVQGERTEKHLGDASLATDLPSAKEDFEEVKMPCDYKCYTGVTTYIDTSSTLLGVFLVEDHTQLLSINFSCYSQS